MFQSSTEEGHALTPGKPLLLAHLTLAFSSKQSRQNSIGFGSLRVGSKSANFVLANSEIISKCWIHPKVFLIEISVSHLVDEGMESGWGGGEDGRDFSSIPLISHYPQHLSCSPSPHSRSRISRPSPPRRSNLSPRSPSRRTDATREEWRHKNLSNRAPKTWLMNFNAFAGKSRWAGVHTPQVFFFFFLFPPCTQAKAKGEGGGGVVTVPRSSLSP